MSPYSELTLKDHFTAGAATVVTFASKGHGSITATPSLVTSTRVVVAVPAFFDSVAATAVAGAAAGNFANIAADYPTYGSSPRATVRDSINATGAKIAAPVLADLARLDALVPTAQASLVALATGQVARFDLGTFGGRAATVNLADVGCSTGSWRRASTARRARSPPGRP